MTYLKTNPYPQALHQNPVNQPNRHCACLSKTNNLIKTDFFHLSLYLSVQCQCSFSYPF